MASRRKLKPKRKARTLGNFAPGSMLEAMDETRNAVIDAGKAIHWSLPPLSESQPLPMNAMPAGGSVTMASTEASGNPGSPSVGWRLSQLWIANWSPSGRITRAPYQTGLTVGRRW
jgi:hypothetical protein